MSVVSEITRIKTNIDNAYIEANKKGATLPALQNSENLAETIASIPQRLGDWRPHEDWFDIDSILENDTENYTGKIICLLTDDEDVSTINRMNASKVVTSDGTVYEDVSVFSFEHIWNKKYDKECDLEYKTRYVIYYYNSNEIDFGSFCLFNTSCLYVIFKDVNIKNTRQTCFKDCMLLEYVKLIDSVFLINETTYQNCCSLVKIPSFLLTNGISSLNSTFSNSNEKVIDLSMNDEKVGNLKTLMNTFLDAKARRIVLFSTGNVTSFFSIFSGMLFLCYINALDFNSAIEVRNMFSKCSRLREIASVSNIKVSGINFGDCKNLSHDTLIRIRDACYDYSADTENTHNIIIGPENIAKLTEEELAEWLQKSWTVS